MFKKLREKLVNWTKKISEEPKPAEIKIEELKKAVGESEEKVRQKKGEIQKEIPVPVKFNEAVQKYEPDLEKLKGIKKEIIQEKGEIKKTEEGKPGTHDFFRKITSKITKIKISEEEFEVYAEELEMLLIENNVALEVAEKIIKELENEIVGKEFLKKELEEEIKDILKEILRGILVEGFLVADKIKQKSEKPYVILFCGINGTGKTTTIAKIASQLKREGISVAMAAGDTFRAASIEQIKTHGEKLGIPVIANQYGSDPASVGFDAISYAKKHKIDCVLIDTAGRMHTAKNLLKEIEKISKVTKPDLKVFVGESITGNDAVEQVKSFDWAIGIDGIILTKADIDEKGGTALSVGYITKKPILYLGTGQDYNKIEPFDKEKFIEKLGLD